jgi:N-acyl homoserine lactone hydrolase
MDQATQTLDSMAKVEGVVSQTGARVVRQHVPEAFASLPRFPEPLR